ncbi:hypothetical protein OU995_14820 [Roseateles sp. SL47]|uniref:hypothetical protein n=1 Tax=Roseateles sp. SL47 TaxID=2995138 RepID=UPI00226D8590|nr:hypothetical protein [Roseateles sp. SL47]WAC70888.1 hypothetical protein OU995_14820 [Roseateles sp. SL47]
MYSIPTSQAFPAMSGGLVSVPAGGGGNRSSAAPCKSLHSPAVDLKGQYALPPAGREDAAVSGHRFASADPKLPPPQLMALPGASHDADASAQMLRFLSSLHQEGRTDLAVIDGNDAPQQDLLSRLIASGEPTQFNSAGTQCAAWVEQQGGEHWLCFDLQNSHGLDATHRVCLHNIDLQAAPDKLMEQVAALDQSARKHQAEVAADPMLSDTRHPASLTPPGGVALACSDGRSLSGSALVLLDAQQRFRRVMDVVNGLESAPLEQAQRMVEAVMDPLVIQHQKQLLLLQGRDWLGAEFGSLPQQKVDAGLNVLKDAVRAQLDPWMVTVSSTQELQKADTSQPQLPPPLATPSLSASTIPPTTASTPPSTSSVAAPASRRPVPPPPVPQRLDPQSSPARAAPTPSSAGSVSSAPAPSNKAKDEAEQANAQPSAKANANAAASPRPARPAPSSAPAPAPAAPAPAAPAPAAAPAAPPPTARRRPPEPPVDPTARRPPPEPPVDPTARRRPPEPPVDPTARRPPPEPPVDRAAQRPTAGSPPPTSALRGPASPLLPAKRPTVPPPPVPVKPRDAAAPPDPASIPTVPTLAELTDAGNPAKPVMSTTENDVAFNALADAILRGTPLDIGQFGRSLTKAQEAELVALGELSALADALEEGSPAPPLQGPSPSLKASLANSPVDTDSPADLPLPTEFPPPYVEKPLTFDLNVKSVLTDSDKRTVKEFGKGLEVAMANPEVLHLAMDDLVAAFQKPKESLMSRFARWMRPEAARAQALQLQGMVIGRLTAGVLRLANEFIPSDPAMASQKYRTERAHFIEQELVRMLKERLARLSPEDRTQVLGQLDDPRSGPLAAWLNKDLPADRKELQQHPADIPAKLADHSISSLIMTHQIVRDALKRVRAE